MSLSNQELTIIISLFSLGFFGGFTHCVGMCGPFVLTQVNGRLANIQIRDITNFKRLSGIALLPYHFGRITTYCFISGTSSFVAFNLKEVAEFKLLSGVLLILAAGVFASVALGGSAIYFKNIVRRFTNKVYRPTSSTSHPNEGRMAKQWIRSIKEGVQKLITTLFQKPNKLNGYLLGTLLGFIPCGLLYAAVLAAASIENYLIAALAMLAFGVGTIPALFLAGYTGSLFFNSFEKNIKLFSKIILIINAITLLIMAVGLIFNKI